MATRLALLALAIAALVVVLSAGRAIAADPTEPELKAELIERFTRFVDWEQLPEKLAICVVGDSPVTAHLERDRATPARQGQAGPRGVGAG